MKKAFVIVFCFVLLFTFVGCGQQAPEESASATLEETPDPVATEEPTSEPEPESFNDMITAENEFNFTSDSFFETLNYDDEFESIHTFEYDEYIANWSTKLGTDFICFSETAGGNVFAVLLVSKYMPNGLYTNAYLQGIADVATLCNTEFDSAGDILTATGYEALGENQSSEITSNDVDIIYTKTIIDSFEGGIVRFAPTNSTIDLSGLPSAIERTEKGEDFFNDEERINLYNEYYMNFQFDELAALVDSYIEEVNPPETDSAYKIKELAENAAAEMPNTVVLTDEFEDSSTLYYKGVEEISKDINMVPSVFGYSDLTITIGFKASDWVFFDGFRIKVGKDDYVTTFIGSKIEDVLTGSGGMVLESSQISLGWDDIDKIINAESPVIRFEGKEEKNLDHTLTENEINALRSLSIIAQARIELSEMRSAWEQDF